MSEINITLESDQLQQLTQLDMSVQHWSLIHTEKTLELQRLIGMINNIYVGRQQFLDKILQEKDIDTKRVINISVMSGNQLQIQLSDPEPTPSDSPIA